MPVVNWNREKAEELRAKYGISFEEMLDQILLGEARSFPHPNPERYPNQRIYVVFIEDYTYVVPYVENEAGMFLKTLYPSRKAKRDYAWIMGGNDGDAQSCP